MTQVCDHKAIFHQSHQSVHHMPCETTYYLLRRGFKSSRGTPSNYVPNKMLEKLLYFSQTLHQPPPKKKTKNVPSSVQKKSQKWDLPAFIYIIATQTEKTTSILQLPTATDDPPSLSVNGFTLVLVIRGKDYITPEKAVYTWYISSIYCLPPFTRT